MASISSAPAGQPHSSGWVSFTYAGFGGSLLMLAFGVWSLPVDWWTRGFLAMGIFLLVQSCITMTKTLRDNHEAAKLINKVEEARTERLLMEVGRS
jgi:hypothetical protein